MKFIISLFYKMDEYVLSPEIKNLIITMRFIGFCPEGKKICFASKTYTNPNSWTWENMCRIYARENNDTFLRRIDEILNEVSQAVHNENNHHTLHLILTSMKEMKTGLNHLKITYKDRPETIASLSVNIDQLEIIIEKLDNRYKRLTSSEIRNLHVHK